MRFVWLVVCLSLCLVARAQKNDIHAVDQLAREFGQAWLRGDTKTLDRLLAREYIHTDVTGRVLHRQEWLLDAGNVQKWLRAPSGAGTPTIEFRDVEVRPIGGVVIVTGKNVIRSANPGNPPMSLRFTQVWVKEDKKWKRRFFQATRLSEP